MGEEISGATLPWTDRVSIGLIDRATQSVFLGYSNEVFGTLPTSRGNTKLVTSDGLIGTTNANFWRYQTTNLPATRDPSVIILDGGNSRATAQDGSQLHLVQNTGGAGGYATLVALRFQRNSPSSRTIRMTVKTTGTSGHNGDILYTNTPSATVLQTNLEAFPTQVQQLGPIELTHVPDTLWAYWPFHSSRLRIHAYGILRSGSG